MNTVTIVLLLSMCFCALCGATPAVSSLDKELIPSNCTNGVATKLQRITRQTFPLNFIEGIGSQLLNVLSDLLYSIIHIIRPIIHQMKSWIENIESLLEKPLTMLNNTQNSNQRRRRSNASNGLSDLIGDLSNLVHLPVSYFQGAASSIGDSVDGQVRNIVNTIAKFIWDFIIMRLLPWLHEIFNKLKDSNVLPSFMNEAIGNADSLYSFLRLFSDITSTRS